MIRILVFSMEMPGRRSDYTFLSQIPDEEVGTGPSTSFFGSIAAEANISKGRTDRVFDWDGSGDHKLNTQANRIGNQYSWIGLQRHSSGSSYDDSSLASDYYAPTLSNAAANEINALGYIHDDEFRVKAVGNGGSSGKSWAQQTEENYQLQLALALRLSSEATCADDPNFMDLMPDEAASRSLSSSAEAISHRFWVRVCFRFLISSSSFSFCSLIILLYSASHRYLKACSRVRKQPSSLSCYYNSNNLLGVTNLSFFWFYCRRRMHNVLFFFFFWYDVF